MKFYFFILCFLCFSCVENDCSQNNNLKNKIQLSFINTEDTIYNFNDFSEFEKFLSYNPVISKQFFETNNDITKNQELYTLINNKYFDSLYFQVKNTFGSFTTQKNEFDNAFFNLKKIFPSLVPPTITTIVSGFYNDIVVSSNNIIIGLDYFLHKNSKYKPQDIPEYILYRYTPQHIIPMTMALYCSRYNQISNLDQTMISEMLDFGKLYFLLSRILPCTPKHLIIGYSKEEWDLIEKNEKTIYSVFVDRKLFFETNHLVKNKYLSERPQVFEVSPSCPGRIGRWLGWKIIKSYMENNPNIEIQNLLSNTDNKEIFFQSFYNPS